MLKYPDLLCEPVNVIYRTGTWFRNICCAKSIHTSDREGSLKAFNDGEYDRNTYVSCESSVR
jgi:hypothetical protein